MVTPVLIHSPLVGSGCWAGVASLLPRALSVDYSMALKGASPFYPRIAETIAAQARGAGDIVLVAHSGAGALIPLAARAIGSKVKGAIFADALLPHAGQSWFDTAPENLQARLRKIAKDGYLPPWDEWWPEGAIQAMLPTAEMRRAFLQQLPSLPLAYFEERVPDAPLPARCAYLLWSAGYEEEAKNAQALGCKVENLALHHLAMLTHPREIAAKLTDMEMKLCC